MVVGTVVTTAGEVIRVVRTADEIFVVDDEVDEGSEEKVVGSVDENSKISFWAPKLCQLGIFFRERNGYQKPSQNRCCIPGSCPTYLRRRCFRQVLTQSVSIRMFSGQQRTIESDHLLRTRYTSGRAISTIKSRLSWSYRSR